MSLKNKIHSEVHKKYIELKRRITSAQYMLEFEKSQHWDMWCRCDSYEFDHYKAFRLKEMKAELNEMHKECRELKKHLVKANQDYNS